MCVESLVVVEDVANNGAGSADAIQLVSRWLFEELMDGINTEEAILAPDTNMLRRSILAFDGDCNCGRSGDVLADDDDKPPWSSP